MGSIYGETVGIVGLGNIGSAFARRMAAFDTTLIACDPYVDDAHFDALGVARVSLEELAERGGPRLAAWLFADEQGGADELHRDLRVLVNGRSIEFLAGVETELSDDDAVTVHLAGARGFPGG